MISRKRKASIQLTSNSVVVLKPAPNNMNTLTAKLLLALDWCAAFVGGLFRAPSTYTTMSYTNQNNDHIQSSASRSDGTTTLKRQKTRPSTSQSRSAIGHSRKDRREGRDRAEQVVEEVEAQQPAQVSHGRRATEREDQSRGRLDLAERAQPKGKKSRWKMPNMNGMSEKEKEKEVNTFWVPPDFDDLDTVQLPQTPEVSDDEDEVDDEDHNKPRRRFDGFRLPMSPESMPERSQSRRSASASNSSHSSPPRQYDRNRPSRIGSNWSLEEKMDRLLVSQEETESRFLNPSNFVIEKRAQLAKERKEAAARAAKKLRLSRRYPRRPLAEELDDRWRSRVQQSQSATSDQSITTSIGGTELRLKDFNTLLGHGGQAWLNDEIVNTYLEWIVDAANKDAAAESIASGEEGGSVPKFIAHNSFFYNNLVDKGPSSTERLMKRKKAPGKSLMEVDTVLIPICKGSHWTVGVVRPIAKTIEYFDSFGRSATHFADLMRSWLQFQLGTAYIERDWEVPNTACAVQSNGWDCGVFVCTNSFCVARGLDTSCYDESVMLQQRMRIAAVLINRGFTGDFQWGKEGF